MIHVAAQGNQPYSIAYFVENGISVNDYDHEMSTPLHWACIQSSLSSVNYLLALGANINAKDKKGYTPLHLCVKAYQNTQNDYLVKKLIMKGANKNIKDNKGHTAHALAIQYEKSFFDNKKNTVISAVL